MANRFTRERPNFNGSENQRNRRTPTPFGRQENEGYERSQSPAGRVHFGGRRFAAARLASPIFMALIVFLSMFAQGLTQNGAAGPMICLPDAPSSLWSFPTNPFCPSWTPTEMSVPMDLTIHRLNTIQYKTDATACKCIKTKISRRIGFFGGQYEEINTSPIEVPTATCLRMKDLNHSPEGELYSLNGTMKATNNSLDVGWGIWPAGIFWKTYEIANCYVYGTVVFTRYGSQGVNTPINECSACDYQAGNCRCPQLSLIWKPDRTQQCAYVKIAKWSGDYSTDIWAAKSGDFALTFVNASVKKDCENKKFIISDQAFAIPKEEFDEMINFKNKLNLEEDTLLKRSKREGVFLPEIPENNLEVIWHLPADQVKKDESVGIVYSSQLAAQLTALSAKVSANTQKLFIETVRKICTSLQFLADQTLVLAEANPSLLARFYLGNPFLSARLISRDTLEVRPCFAISEREMHFQKQDGHCFERLPITFHLYGKQKHGFLDPNTLIIHSDAKQADCHKNRFLYIETNGQLTLYDQISGDMKQIPPEAVHHLSRYGRIDFPEVHAQFFKNKVMANLNELYSPEHFDETIAVAKVVNEIARLSRPDVWEGSTERTDRIAAKVVANGLFAFLKGGIFSLNQLWIFLCCCYTTWTLLIQFLLPFRIAHVLQYPGIIQAAINFWRFVAGRNRRATTNRPKDEEDVTNLATISYQNNPIQEPPIRSILRKSVTFSPELTGTTAARQRPISGNFENFVPLTERWLMQKPELGVATMNSEGRDDRGSKAPNVVSVSVAETICDENYRISGKVNKIGAVLLLDTGAHVSICSLSTAMKYGIGALKRSEIVGVLGLGEHTVQILGVADIILEIAGCKILTNVFVVEKEIGRNGKYDLIIGRNTLKKLPLLLDLQNGSLTQKDGGIFVCEKSAVNEMKTWSKKQGEGQLEALNQCIQKYSNVFSKHEYDLGECVFEAPPILTTSAMPERIKPYPVPEKYEEELKKHIKKMLEADIIRETCTPWAHNIVLVKKTNGQLRPCVDFRPLNKITLPDPYPIPRMDKTILRASGKKWYSTLDLASGFWQIPLDEQSSDKCGIVTPWGLYQMRKLPFGLKNAPSIFQRVMDKILGDLKNVTAYIDDILIHTNTEKEHLETLAKVFTELEKSGLKLKREKCVFMKNKCTYLGHILDEAGYRPSLNNQEVIQAFPEPKSVKEIKRFLGMISFFRKFIPNFAMIAHPLNEMTKGNNQIGGLTDEGSQAFKQLKIKLLEAPCLQAPDYGKCFYLFTDASAVAYAYAGALMQTKNGNEMHAVGYWSRTLSPAESKLPPTHSELAAIVCAVQNFKPIIYVADLTILTDHRPLSFLFSKACTNPKLNRWLMELQEFEPRVIYVEGKANKVADALSRVPINGDK